MKTGKMKTNSVLSETFNGKIEFKHLTPLKNGVYYNLFNGDRVEAHKYQGNYRDIESVISLNSAFSKTFNE